MQLLAFLAGAVADVPTMILQTYHIAHTSKANGIKVAGNGFLEVDTPCSIGFLYQAIAPPVMVGTGKDTILVVDDRGNPLARWVDIGDTLRFDYATGFFGHIGQQEREYLLYLLLLVILKRCTGIAFDTATPSAGIQVATELLLENV